MAVRWTVPPDRAGGTAPDWLTDTRARVASAPVDPQLAELATDVMIGGVDCVSIGDIDSTTVLVYFHGGGYRMGTPRGWLRLADDLAGRLHARVVLADYRLAPEHPFPAALRDATAVYADLLEDDPGVVLVGGDSAGGGLACALTVACIRDQVRGPDGLILLSPWLDLTLRNETHSSHATSDVLFPPASSTVAAAQYLAGHDATDPLVSPGLATDAALASFPPSFITVGSEETLLDDALSFSRRLARAGTSVMLHVGAGMQHVWPLMHPDLAESVAVMNAIRQFGETISARSATDTTTESSATHISTA